MLRTLVVVSALALAAVPALAQGNDLQGTWVPEKAQLGGKPFEDIKSIRLEIKGSEYTVTAGPTVDRGGLKVDPAKTPKEMVIVGTEGPNKGKAIPAIYERQGDTLRICYDLSGKSAPKSFESKAGTELYLVTYKRQS